MHRKERSTIPAGILIILSIFLLAMQGQSPEDIERRRLVEQQAKLSDRIASLNHEQKYLLMQKAFYASDSKYLLLDLSSRTGMLKYRNRVLRTFPFSATTGKRPFPGNTILKMTAKTEGTARKRMLLFGDELVIRSKRSSLAAGKGKAEATHILIGSKDFTAIYYAVEQGTMLYTGK